MKTATIECQVREGMFSDEVVAEIGDRAFIVPKSKLLGAVGPRARVRVQVFDREGRQWLMIPTDYKEVVPSPAGVQVVVEET